MNTDYGDRIFRCWVYQVSHDRLLLRSTMCPMGPYCVGKRHETNVDLVFIGVAYMSLPSILRGLIIEEPTPADFERLRGQARPLAEHDRLFVLVSEGIRHCVVALQLVALENLCDHFELPPGMFEFLPNRSA